MWSFHGKYGPSANIPGELNKMIIALIIEIAVADATFFVS